MKLFNYFVVTTWQHGANQHSTVVRSKLGHTFLDRAGSQYWTGKGWSKHESRAKKFKPDSRAATRTMHAVAQKDRHV